MILGYVRVSSADQAKGDRSSLQVQQDVIEGFARTRGVDKWDVQIYTDAGVSGAVKLAFRPSGEKLLQDMKHGDVVIASKLDRMFRSASDAIDMFDVFKQRGVDLVLFDISHEPVSAGVGKLIMTILAAVADMERIRIKERTAEGRKAKKARGGLIGEVPFGYRKIGEGRAAYLVPHEGERETARLMHELFQRNHKYTEISRRLSEAGYHSRAGKPYTRAGIKRLLLRGGCGEAGRLQ
jgi:DNA invertase Pin-like site-specific DNA recombinase